MHMRSVWVFFVMTASACSSAPTPKEQLEGMWATAPDAQGCIDVATFKDSAIELDTSCLLSTGAVGLDAEVGSFAATDDTVSVAISQATCPTAKADASFTLSYSFLDGALRLIGANGGVSLTPFPSTPVAAGVAIKFGCWDGDEKNFTPGPLAPPT